MVPDCDLPQLQRSRLAQQNGEAAEARLDFVVLDSVHVGLSTN